MCGIAGILFKNNRYIDPKLLTNISNSIIHRGPDDEGFLTWSNEHGVQKGRAPHSLNKGSLALIHRRLSILDLSPAGWQPISSSDNNYHITYNGEVYNYLELRSELQQAGFVFTSDSDTEVVLKAYIYWGKECLNKFIGMFSFVILDLKARQLFCARDFFGIKPFYYSLTEQGFVFASEIKALLQTELISTKSNAQVSYNYLAFGKQEGKGQTFFEDISELPPASFMSVSIDSLEKREIQKYWSIDLHKRSDLSFKDASVTLKNLFLDSVKLHMRSDVPIAATLSGGIDSSSIVMALRKVSTEHLDLHTISFIADQKEINEEYWIDIINKASGSSAHKIIPLGENLISDIYDLTYTQEQPVGSSSIYAQYQVFKKIKELGFKVVLDGQGADEFLGGYRSYLYSRMKSLMRQKKIISLCLLAFNTSRLPGIDTELKKILTRIFHFLTKHAFNNSGKTASNHLAWINSKWCDTQNISSQQNFTAQTMEVLKAQLYDTFTESSLPQLLKVEDRNSMAFSIESRVPFLTPKMAEFIFSLPEEYLINDSATTKYVFREALKDIVPIEIMKRKDKIGFTTPEKKWLMENSDWVESVLKSEVAYSIPMINPEAMIQEWNALIEGKTNFCWRFWRWLNFIIWTEKFNIKHS